MGASLLSSVAAALGALAGSLPARPEGPTWAVAASTTLLLLLASTAILYALTKRPQPTGIAGPPPYPFVGNVFHIDMHNLPKAFNALHDAYGRVVKVHLGPRVMVSVADVGVAEAIFSSPRGAWSNSDLFRYVFGPLFPRAVIVVEGAAWRRIRRLLHGAVVGGKGGEGWPSGKDGVLPITRAAVERALGRVGAAAAATMAGSASVVPGSNSVDAGTPVDMMAWSQEVMFESLGGYVYGVDWRLYPDPESSTPVKIPPHAAGDTEDAVAPSHRALFDAMSVISEGLPRRVSRPWRLWWALPIAENRRMWDALATVRRELADIIAARRVKRARARLPGALPLPPVPLLDSLLNAGSEAGVSSPLPTGEVLSEEDIIDNAASIAFASTDTTAATVSFLFYHLATNPQIQVDLATEIEAATAPDLPSSTEDSDTGNTLSTGKGGCGGTGQQARKQLSAKELDALPLLSAVIAESSRLLPTSIGVPRTPRKAFTHGDMVIPAGTLVVINVLRMGQDEALWPAPAPGVTPQDFNVNRWLHADSASQKCTAYAHLPFGAGDRSCPGRPVAMTQVKTIVAQVLGAGWELQPVEGRELKLATRLAMVPEAGAWVNFRRRQR